MSAAPKSFVIGELRPAEVYVPSSYQEGQTLPLVLFLHGYANNGFHFSQWLKIPEASEANGFIALVPRGTPDPSGNTFWNALPECCDNFQSGRDDVSYLLDLITKVQDQFPIGETYIFGHSNGGLMAYRLMCEAPSRLTGIVSIAGAFYKDPQLCRNPKAISVLQIHGRLDPVVPYGDNDKFSGAVETVENIAKLLHCSSSELELKSLDLISFDWKKDTDVRRFQGCDAQTKLALWSIQEGLHNPRFRDVITQAWNFIRK